MKLLWKEVKKYKLILSGALILATINQVFSLLDPQIFRLIVDNYASKASSLSRTDFISGVSLLLAGTVGVAFVSRVAKAFQDYYVNVIVQRTGTNLYSQSVEHSFSLPYAVFEDQRSGELLNKLQKARTDSQALIVNLINIVFLSLIGIVFVLVYATIVHPLIGLVYFLILPTMGTATFILSKKIKEAQRAIVRETAALSGSTTETLRNVELVKSLGLERQEINRLNNVNEKILDLELKKVKFVRSLDFIQGTLINALRSGLLLLMLWLIFRGEITLGQFFTLLFYSFAIFAPLSMLGTVAASYQEARASLDQLGEILKLDPTPKPENPKHLGEIESITYRDVELSYGQEGREALTDVNLEVKARETVAFVGPSGSGKSSMIKLLAGLYNPTKGDILFNNISIKNLDIDELRRRIGLVTQETQLFAGTIRENLLFVRPDATDEECVQVLESAQAKSILDKGENGSGLDIKIGEGGVRLSGGERQRLAIARALLRKPDLIVFDEATSSLDSITEKAITETIKKIREAHPNISTVLVAHRLSTILHADRIYVFERGKVVESGKHEELISRGGLYSALWREQIAGDK
ncbi:ABC transporter ATP-binding protein/permease [Candidatus Parcubacteria bacterium]|nr:ABC transporter ATP-binding protein/permease [Candidatus Parcubacteria bacterium]